MVDINCYFCEVSPLLIACKGVIVYISRCDYSLVNCFCQCLLLYLAVDNMVTMAQYRDLNGDTGFRGMI